MSADLDLLEVECAQMKSTLNIMVADYEKVTSKLEIVQGYLNSAMTRLTFLKNTLSQLIQFQVNMHSNPAPNDIILGIPVSTPIPKEYEIIEIADNDKNETVMEVTVKTEPVENENGNGNVGMDCDNLVNEVINNDNYNELD